MRDSTVKILRSGLKLGYVILSLAWFCCLSGAPALAQPPAPPKAAGGALNIDLVAMQKPWTGDLDRMIERRVIRVLTVGRAARHRR